MCIPHPPVPVIAGRISRTSRITKIRTDRYIPRNIDSDIHPPSKVHGLLSLSTLNTVFGKSIRIIQSHVFIHVHSPRNISFTLFPPGIHKAYIMVIRCVRHGIEAELFILKRHIIHDHAIYIPDTVYIDRHSRLNSRIIIISRLIDNTV